MTRIKLFFRRLMCKHRFMLVDITYDGGAVYECRHCKKTTTVKI